MSEQADIKQDALVVHILDVLNGGDAGILLSRCSAVKLAHDLKQVVAEELQRLVDRAFPDGEDSDYHYGCEALLEYTQDRIAALRPTEEQQS